LNIASQLSYPILSVAGDCYGRAPKQTTGRIGPTSLAVCPTVTSSASGITLSWAPRRGGQNRGRA
jgi:hypothetical protein